MWFHKYRQSRSHISTGYFRFGQRVLSKFISDGVVSLIYLTCTDLGTTVLIFLASASAQQILSIKDFVDRYRQKPFLSYKFAFWLAGRPLLQDRDQGLKDWCQWDHFQNREDDSSLLIVTILEGCSHHCCLAGQKGEASCFSAQYPSSQGFLCIPSSSARARGPRSRGNRMRPGVGWHPISCHFLAYAYSLWLSHCWTHKRVPPGKKICWQMKVDKCLPYIHTVEYYSALKRNPDTCYNMDEPKDIWLRESASHTKRTKDCIISLLGRSLKVKV